MPELPEVQTIVNDLNEKIIDETIVDFWSDWKKRVRPNFSKFKKEIIGAKIKEARRIGKHIIIDLANKKSVIIHLKMSGHLLFKPVDIGRLQKEFLEKVNQYIHHKIIFKSGNTLDFSDLRKFGWLEVIETKKVDEMKEISQLGVDALGSSFTLKKFKEILDKKPKSVVGTLLLDQKVIAGIGNIYRSEILFSAKVHPERKVQTLSDGEIEKIFKYTKSILRRAIKMRGTSDSDYRDLEGKLGNFQKVLNVYRREGEVCKKCKKTKIARKKLGQRSYFYCFACQK